MTSTKVPAEQPDERTPADEQADLRAARAARPVSASGTPADRQRMLEQYPLLKAAAEAWAKR